MDLVGRALMRGWRRIAFIGASKHAGKTTALNFVIRQAQTVGQSVAARGRSSAMPQQRAAVARAALTEAGTGADTPAATTLTVGLCSIGLDGERLDTVLGVPKPDIVAPAGALVASAEEALAQSDALLEWLEVLPIGSPLGDVAIVRVLEPGRVMLAGVRQRAHVRLALDRLTAHGAELCLVDGAFDRAAAAIPGLVDAAVLAVSPVLGRTPALVAEAVAPIVARFALPALAGEAAGAQAAEGGAVQTGGLAAVGTPGPGHQAWEAAARTALAGARAQGEIGVWCPTGETHTYPAQAAMHRPLSALPGWPTEARVVYVPGAVTDRLLEGLRGHPAPLYLVADHPAHLFATTRAVAAWYAAGHALCVWTRLPLLAIAANPHHILGWDLPRAALIEALQAVAGDVPVIDACTEEA
ncbi:hypothetical protein [Alicyclobacillus macrosporangiidus]|uniref:lysine 5,6-aminomutase reactivase subunit KamB n=1 Tax=Alicyclobacillus macrosporangiidus TaxID=392015 RepID=UPI000A52A1D8|nr:hypothetical protein [Alicyclobacillus macrosporangiidus]